LGFVAAVLSLTVACEARAQFPPAPGTGPGLPETIEAIDAARVTTRILYVTAHPDDESSAVLTYLARGLHADVALLSLTRGEGGQNALGPEQAPQLGLIRTQELLAATRGYGVKLYFTRARDFGFSKTPEETEKIWGDQVLDDMVRVIRTFRPNVVINNWGGVHGGHGHHQASGLLTPTAVQMAADSKAFPEQLKDGLTFWDGGAVPVQVLDLERGSEHPTGYVLPLDEVSPLWGKTWREIGIDAFANHRTQGVTIFLGSPFLRRPIAVIPEGGGKFSGEGLNRPLTEILGKQDGETCKAHQDWCAKLDSTDKDLVNARSAALLLNWKATTEDLNEAARQLSSLYKPDAASSTGPLPREPESEVRGAVERVARALELAAGLEFTAEGDRNNLVGGESSTVTLTYHCRPGVQCPVEGSSVWVRGEKEEAKGTGDPAKGIKYEITTGGSADPPSVWDQLDPVAGKDVIASLQIKVGEGRSVPRSEPVVHIDATTTHVSRVPVRIVPAYGLAVEPNQEVEVLEKRRQPFDVLLRVHSYATQAGKVSVGLDLPNGWKSSAPVDLEFAGTGDRYAKLTVTPPEKLTTGNYNITAYAKRGDEKFSTSLEPLPSMPTLTWNEPAECKVHAFDINVPQNLRVGYISSEGEPVPEALERLGIHVEMLDAAALNFGDLSKFDAIVVGVRAYELRPELPGANQRLLDYVSKGGTLVVQYERDFAWDRFQYAPYPARIDPGRQGAPLPRITDENSPVKFLKPEDSLLNKPNKITQKDFEGWVQERGLYFWSQFDEKYTPLLAMNDPGEPDLNGGLVYTHVGKGTYIYTGLAFFRQLPEGVPGAYRLFVNLLSASRGH
jgi:LmbE family N-acetylglucosaminyl deacetylase